jgi:putative transposase
MDEELCLDVFEEAVEKYGAPDTINTDLGTQYTGDAWGKAVGKAGSKLSQDGKGRWADNIYIERLWRTAKYENIFPNDCQTVTELREIMEEYIVFYNNKRLHSKLNYKTPAEVYLQGQVAPDVEIRKKKEAKI